MVHDARVMTALLSTRPPLVLVCSAALGISACAGADDPSGEAKAGDATGGALIADQSDSGTGGNTLASSGGAGTGGAGTGGADLATGGVSPGTGGAVAGTGGVAGGTGGAASGTGGDSGGEKSSGCGAAAPPVSGDYTIMVNGKTRDFTLDVPDGYDTNSAYPIVFGLHWRGGNSGDVVGNGFYGLKERASGSMIFVSPEGLVADGTSGWANAGGEDVEFIALMLDRFESELCVDTTRVFATGFSYGGMFSNAIGCGLADRFTAIAPYSGSLWSGCEDGTSPIAYLGTHGNTDTVVGIEAGRQARDEFIERNGCTSETTSYGENGCVAYNGCQEPVVWCEYNDGHWWPGFASDEVWDFFGQF